MTRNGIAVAGARLLGGRDWLVGWLIDFDVSQNINKIFLVLYLQRRRKKKLVGVSHTSIRNGDSKCWPDKLSRHVMCQLQWYSIEASGWERVR